MIPGQSGAIVGTAANQPPYQGAEDAYFETAPILMLKNLPFQVSGGFGEYMLRKMGWREGEGLGKDRSGDVDPLQLDIKMDKKGLISAEEKVVKGRLFQDPFR